MARKLLPGDVVKANGGTFTVMSDEDMAAFLARREAFQKLNATEQKVIWDKLDGSAR